MAPHRAQDVRIARVGVLQFLGLESNAKKVGLMRDLLPNAYRFAVLLNPANTFGAEQVAVSNLTETC